MLTRLNETLDHLVKTEKLVCYSDVKYDSLLEPKKWFVQDSDNEQVRWGNRLSRTDLLMSPHICHKVAAPTRCHISLLFREKYYLYARPL